MRFAKEEGMFFVFLLSYEQEFSVFGECPEFVIHHEFECVDMMPDILHEGNDIVMEEYGLLSLVGFSVCNGAPGFELRSLCNDSADMFFYVLD